MIINKINIKKSLTNKPTNRIKIKPTNRIKIKPKHKTFNKSPKKGQSYTNHSLLKITLSNKPAMINNSISITCLISLNNYHLNLHLLKKPYLDK